jgi:hydroxymethylpyrimidine pyrophosphatase-like HAD family hydrolase
MKGLNQGFMNRKYFFFDIDDTLLVHGQDWDSDYVPDSTKEALRLLEENGHFTAIATGRSYCMAKKYMEDLGFKNMVHDGGNGITIDGKMLGIEPLDYKLHIHKDNRPNSWVTEINSWIKTRIDYYNRPSSWKEYIERIDCIRTYGRM